MGRKKIEYKENDIVGNSGIKYIKDGDVHYSFPTNRKRRSGIFICHCGKTFESIIADVAANKISSCGCGRGRKGPAYSHGELINNIKFLKILGKNNQGGRMALFECPVCGGDWKSSILNVKFGNSKHCGCRGVGFTRKTWEKFCKQAYLYKVLLYDEKESFIKIGMTAEEDICKRFRRIPYNSTILKSIKGNPGYIFDLECRTKRLFKEFKYKPLKKFGGETECYINNK